MMHAKPTLVPIIDIREMLEDAVETGTRYGLNRAYKHDDNPSHDTIVELIVNNVMNNLWEKFEIEEGV